MSSRWRAGAAPHPRLWTCIWRMENLTRLGRLVVEARRRTARVRRHRVALVRDERERPVGLLRADSGAAAQAPRQSDAQREFWRLTRYCASGVPRRPYRRRSRRPDGRDRRIRPAASGSPDSESAGALTQVRAVFDRLETAEAQPIRRRARRGEQPSLQATLLMLGIPAAPSSCCWSSRAAGPDSARSASGDRQLGQADFRRHVRRIAAARVEGRDRRPRARVPRDDDGRCTAAKREAAEALGPRTGPVRDLGPACASRPSAIHRRAAGHDRDRARASSSWTPRQAGSCCRTRRPVSCGNPSPKTTPPVRPTGGAFRARRATAHPVLVP